MGGWPLGPYARHPGGAAGGMAGLTHMMIRVGGVLGIPSAHGLGDHPSGGGAKAGADAGVGQAEGRARERCATGQSARSDMHVYARLLASPACLPFLPARQALFTPYPPTHPRIITCFVHTVLPVLPACTVLPACVGSQVLDGLIKELRRTNTRVDT